MKSPKIRFKEFNSKWDLTTLGDISKRIVRKNSNNETSLPLTISSQFGLIDQKNFFNHQVASKNLSNYYLLYKNEFAYNKSYSIGYDFGSIKRLKFYDKGALSTLYICFSFDKKFNTEFFEYYFDSLKWYKNIRNICAEGARNHGLLNVLYNDFFTIKINFPTDLKEQEAIGEFFKNIDEILNLEKLRFKKFENFKKTMLDKLFVASGENTPRLRLGSFTSTWTSVTLGEVCEIFRGLTYSPNDIAKQGVKVLRSSNIKNSKFIENNDDVFVKEKAVNIKKIQDLDILITSANGSTNLVGKHAIITKAKNMVHGGFMLLLRAKNPYFINALMDTSWYNNFISLNVHGGNGAIGNLKANDLLNAKIQIPTDLKEQEAIGEFFKKIDEILELSQNRISKLENIKKYLLNKMFV